jgi:CheY-like chemotaxis protein
MLKKALFLLPKLESVLGLFNLMMMKVLVVHRQRSVIENIKAQLAKWHVESFDNGLDGLLIARERCYDLILSGRDLPVVTSIEMIRSIRNLSLNQRTPIILVADGTETDEHNRIFGILDATLLTMEEVEEMENLTIE